MSINHVQREMCRFTAESPLGKQIVRRIQNSVVFFWIKFDSEISECSKSANFNRNQFLTTWSSSRTRSVELDRTKSWSTESDQAKKQQKKSWKSLENTRWIIPLMKSFRKTLHLKEQEFNHISIYIFRFNNRNGTVRGTPYKSSN